MKVLIDTNVALRWSDSGSPLHSVCLDAVRHLVKQGWEVCVCAQVLIELWAACTRPLGNNGLGLSVDQTDRMVNDARLVFTRLPEPPDIAERWQELARKHKVLGKQAHDARLVALMLSHGITQLLTLNTSDFARYPEITPLTPAVVLSL